MPTTCTPDDQPGPYGHVWHYQDDGIHMGPPEGTPCLCGQVLSGPTVTIKELIAQAVAAGDLAHDPAYDADAPDNLVPGAESITFEYRGGPL
jgi:hypothetical protein